MKFDSPVSIGGKTWIFLRTDEGEIIGGIVTSFQSSRQAPFSSNVRPGYLTVTASVWDKTGAEVVVARMTDSTCRRKVDAEKLSRKWIRDNNIRDRMVEEAEKLLAS